MAEFAGYGFAKSHSTAYALITYQTAYLKANHPARVPGGAAHHRVRQPRQALALHRPRPADGTSTILAPSINESASATSRWCPRAFASGWRA